MDTLFSSANFWVLVSFVALFAFLGKRVYLTLTGAIDERTDKIRQQLEEASRLQKESQKLLKTYKKKHEEAVEKSIQIVSHAEKEAIELKRSSERELENFIKIKEKAMEERLSLAQEEAVRLLREEVLKESFILVEEVLKNDTRLQKTLSQSALENLEKVSLKKAS